MNKRSNQEHFESGHSPINNSDQNEKTISTYSKLALVCCYRNPNVIHKCSSGNEFREKEHRPFLCDDQRLRKDVVFSKLVSPKNTFLRQKNIILNIFWPRDSMGHTSELSPRL